MARTNAMHKPGERAPETGTYYCYVCSLRGETSTCSVERGGMFVACPRCLERKVPEWDLTWKAEKSRPRKGRTDVAHPWPGSLAKPV